MFPRFFIKVPVFIGNLFRIIFWYVVVGTISFLIGQSLPREKFDPQSFPYHPFGWEKGGKVYLKLRIQFWKDKMPDMSRYISTMFRKKINVMRSPEYMKTLIAETCVAEIVHWGLIFVSPIFMVLMDGSLGVFAFLAFALGNLPFVLIQRYNRPRLMVLLERQRQAEERNRIQQMCMEETEKNAYETV